jgi:hypothetical protein
MKGFRTYKIVCIALVVVYILANYFKPKETNWAPSFLKEDKIPFGTYILYKRIHDIFRDAKVTVSNQAIYNTIKAEKNEPSNYLITAFEVQISKIDFKEMVKYMEKGNTIFLASYQFNPEILKHLKLNIKSDISIKNNDNVYINFTNPLLKKDQPYRFDRGLGQQYFSKIDTAKAIVLGLDIKNSPNFIKYNYGRGALYILPNPQLLTNYSLLNPDGLDYASKALSYLPQHKKIIWDEYFTKPSTENTSVLRALFNHVELRWAYYLTLFALIFFVLYEIKRRQRIIPVIERPKNTSVEFANVVGRVYYQQRDNRDIAEKKVSYLLEFIRSNYRIKTSVIDEEFKQSIIKLADVDENTVSNLINEILKLKQNQMVSDTDLIRLNKIIEIFLNHNKTYGRRNV